MIDWSGLDAAIAGDVVQPSDPDWDAARQAWNLAADQHPAVVVRAAARADLAATVRFAGANGLRVAPQSTGHGAPVLGDLSDAILLRTGGLTGVAVDPGARTARVQSGTPWRQVVETAGEHGLACLHGMSGGVGVAGYTLGGGVGWLARREGFSSTHVRSFDVVTADGEERHVDADHEPDLFWALRGGGGTPVIVAALELELFPLREAFAGALLWPMEQASEIVHAYRAWIASAPDSVTSTLKLLRVPPVPEVPEPLRGRQLVAITLVFTGGANEGDELVAPLRATADPYLDTLAMVPATALADVAGDPPGPLPGIGGSMLLDRFTEEAADAYVELAGPGAEIPLVGLEVRHLGGALRHPTADPGAAGAVEEEALVYGVGMPVTPEVGAAIRSTLDAVRARLVPWAAERGTLLTFDEQDPGVRGSLPPDAAERLAGIAARYDPDRRLQANHVAR
jgi:hypothetical protein